MSELSRIRRAYDTVEEADEESVAVARQVLLDTIECVERPGVSRAKNRRAVLAFAAAILIGALVATPALGIGGHLVDLFDGTTSPREARTSFSANDAYGARIVAFATLDRPNVWVVRARVYDETITQIEVEIDGAPAVFLPVVAGYAFGTVPRDERIVGLVGRSTEGDEVTRAA